MADLNAPKSTSDALMGDFAHLIANMSRFIVGLAGIPLFRDAGISLSEWVALSLLKEATEIGNAQLANKLGVSRQRANQIIAVLAQANLISIVISKDDARKREIRLTASGITQLQSLNRQLNPLVSEVFGNHEKKAVALATRIQQLMRIVVVANTTEARPIFKQRRQ